MRTMVLLSSLSAVLAGCASMAPLPMAPPTGTAPLVLAETNWRVAAVNGVGTRPDGTFFMNFDRDKFGAKFGCNGMGADYVQRGDVLDAGAVIGTKMACPDMNYENQAAAILAQDMRIMWTSPGNLRLINDRGTIDLIRS